MIANAEADANDDVVVHVDIQDACTAQKNPVRSGTRYAMVGIL